MQEERIDAFIIPSTDPHNSEYPPAYWQTREWITGFTGSAGTAVVLQSGLCALWTDSRYFTQAAAQIAETPFELMREGVAGVPTIAEWIAANVETGRVVSYVSEQLTAEAEHELLDALLDAYTVQASDIDPFRTLWTDRPARPSAPVEIVPEALAGESARSKLSRIFAAQRAECPEMKLYLVNDLAQIAWALNLRGTDIPFNTVFLAYLFVGEHRSFLFTEESRLSEDVKAHLRSLGVTIYRYKGWRNFLVDNANGLTAAAPATANCRLLSTCEAEGIDLHIVPCHIDALKAVKNATEQDGFRRAHLADGRAMVRFLRWLDEAVPAGKETELSVAKKLEAFRKEETGYRGLSFETIAGFGPHGAIVHYEPTPATDAPLEPRSLLLLDSGAHYDTGTTDITRTIALGPTTAKERRIYTLVLKGHIALSAARFPVGTRGIQLDLAARYAMWQQGYDFGHGTGHGVGHRLTVHEGPQQIRKDLRASTQVPFAAGMTITDEPGIYLPGRFGVRIENMLLTVPASPAAMSADAAEFGTFLQFEPLTLCPIDLRPVDRSLLSPTDVAWLNAYHATVRDALLPTLTDAADRLWLERATEAI